MILTIGQLAKAAEVPTSTVRFYERRGLIGPDACTRANYRTFTAQTLERLRFIRAAQASGFSLKDIREMLALAHFDEPRCIDESSSLTGAGARLGTCCGPVGVPDRADSGSGDRRAAVEARQGVNPQIVRYRG
jgi:DNA-binding transcriptional MerR regulator